MTGQEYWEKVASTEEDKRVLCDRDNPHYNLVESFRYTAIKAFDAGIREGTRRAVEPSLN